MVLSDIITHKPVYNNSVLLHVACFNFLVHRKAPLHCGLSMGQNEQLLGKSPKFWKGLAEEQRKKISTSFYISWKEGNPSLLLSRDRKASHCWKMTSPTTNQIHENGSKNILINQQTIMVIMLKKITVLTTFGYNGVQCQGLFQYNK